MRDGPRFLNATQREDAAPAVRALQRRAANAPARAARSWHRGCNSPGQPLWRSAMSPSESSTRPPASPPSVQSGAGETIVELSFALLIVGIWLVTCLAG
jgi:hypothetical protein